MVQTETLLNVIQQHSSTEIFREHGKIIKMERKIASFIESAVD